MAQVELTRHPLLAGVGSSAASSASRSRSMRLGGRVRLIRRLRAGDPVAAEADDRSVGVLGGDRVARVAQRPEHDVARRTGSRAASRPCARGASEPRAWSTAIVVSSVAVLGVRRPCGRPVRLARRSAGPANRVEVADPHAAVAFRRRRRSGSRAAAGRRSARCSARNDRMLSAVSPAVIARSMAGCGHPERRRQRPALHIGDGAQPRVDRRAPADRARRSSGRAAGRRLSTSGGNCAADGRGRRIRAVPRRAALPAVLGAWCAVMPSHSASRVYASTRCCSGSPPAGYSQAT